MSHEARYDFAAAKAVAVRTERKKQTTKLKLHDPTSLEVESAFVQLGFDPATITVERLCQVIYYNFYKARTELPVEKRDPNRDCKACPVFGQACDLLGLITDMELREHKLWLHSGAMVIVESQVVCLIDLVSYIRERDTVSARRAFWTKQTVAETEPMNAWMDVNGVDKDYVFVDYVDANGSDSGLSYWSNAVRSVTQNLLALVGANTVEC